jgi:hypothetical protein
VELHDRATAWTPAPAAGGSSGNAAGAPTSPTEYAVTSPNAKAMIKAAEYLSPHEPPDSIYPFVLTTGRTLN